MVSELAALQGQKAHPSSPVCVCRRFWHVHGVRWPKQLSAVGGGRLIISSRSSRRMRWGLSEKSAENYGLEKHSPPPPSLGEWGTGPGQDRQRESVKGVSCQRKTLGKS